MDPSVLATILITKATETFGKSFGESLGKALSNLGESLLDKIRQLKEHLNAKEPKTMKMLELLEEEPTLLETVPDRFGVPVLAKGMKEAARKHEEISALLYAIAEDIYPYLSPEDKDIIRQIAFEIEHVSGSVKIRNFDQMTESSSKGNSQVEQTYIKGAKISGDLEVNRGSQIIRNTD